mgnify:CR=1 FL=1
MREVDYRTLSEGKIHGPQHIYVPQNLLNAEHVWVRINRVQRPLEAPYSGLFDR